MTPKQYFEWKEQQVKGYNRRDALLSKLVQAANEVDTAQQVLDLAQIRLDEAREIETKVREELEGIKVVQVVYLAHTTGNGWLDTPLQTRTPYDYVDNTDEGLRVGDVVVAPTAYGDRMAIVAQVGGPRTYWGPLKKITEVLYP